MKHIYYGQKRKAYIYVDKLSIMNLDNNLNYYTATKYDKENLERDIGTLNSNRNSRFVFIQYKITKNDIYITEKDHEHVCNIKDEVNLGVHQGKILDRIYDAANDVMHYFTDIVVLNIKDENIDNELNEKKQKVLEQLQYLYDTYFPEKEEVKKGFWKRLFS